MSLEVSARLFVSFEQAVYDFQQSREKHEKVLHPVP